MKILTGITSYGMSGKLFHAPFIDAHPGFELVAIVERHNEDSKERYPNATIFRSVEELCKDERLNLIIVNTPTHLHYEHVKIALQAGKNVLVEKPFTITVKEAEELTALAKERGLNLTIYQNRRYDGDYDAVKKVVDSNILGELREVEIRYDRYRPAYGGKPHKEGNLPGAGIIYDLSPHLVDQVLQLFGWPEAIFADVWKMRDDVAVPDYFEILFYYDRKRVRIKATCIARETDHAYILHGMKGSFLQHRSDKQEQELLAGTKPSIQSWCPPSSQPDGILHTDIDGVAERREQTSSPGNYMGLFSDLHDFYSGKRSNPIPPEDGIRTIKVIEAAMKSAKEGVVVKV